MDESTRRSVVQIAINHEHEPHARMWFRLSREEQKSDSLEFFTVKKVALGKRGKASEELKAGESYVVTYVARSRTLMRVREIVGVKVGGEWTKGGLYGERWKLKDVVKLFEVGEFDVVEDRLRDNLILISEVGLPAWVDHLHVYDALICPRI